MQWSLQNTLRTRLNSSSNALVVLVRMVFPRTNWWRIMRTGVARGNGAMADPRRARAPAVGGELRKPVGRALHAPGTAIEDVRVEHRRAHVSVSEELLHGADVVAVLEEVGRKGVTEGVAG